MKTATSLGAGGGWRAVAGVVGAGARGGGERMKPATSWGASGGWRVVAALVAAMTVGLFGVLLIASGPAQAHDHRIPGTVLKKGAKGLKAGALREEVGMGGRQ